MRFLAGFAVASLLWGGFIFAYSRGMVDVDLEPPPSDAELAALAAAAQQDEADEAQGPRKKRRRRPHRRKRRQRLTGEALSGDDLGDPSTREFDPTRAGGEEQLLDNEVEAGFDNAMPQIKRCLFLAADEDPVTGRLVFGLRIAGSGRVTAVNIKGPSAITRTEAGKCMRDAVRSVRFRSFNGPDMLVHLPLTLN